MTETLTLLLKGWKSRNNVTACAVLQPDSAAAGAPDCCCWRRYLVLSSPVCVWYVINSDDVVGRRPGPRSATVHYKPASSRRERFVHVVRVGAVERASSSTGQGRRYQSFQGRRHLRAGDTLRRRWQRWRPAVVNVRRCKAADQRPTRTTRGA